MQPWKKQYKHILIGVKASFLLYVVDENKQQQELTCFEDIQQLLMDL